MRLRARKDIQAVLHTHHAPCLRAASTMTSAGEIPTFLWGPPRFETISERPWVRVILLVCGDVLCIIRFLYKICMCTALVAGAQPEGRAKS